MRLKYTNSMVGVTFGLLNAACNIDTAAADPNLHPTTVQINNNYLECVAHQCNEVYPPTGNFYQSLDPTAVPEMYQAGFMMPVDGKTITSKGHISTFDYGSVYSSITSPVDARYDGSSLAELGYSFEVVGPSDVQVPLIVTRNVSFSSGSTQTFGQASASVGINKSGVLQEVAESCSGTGSQFCTNSSEVYGIEYYRSGEFDFPIDQLTISSDEQGLATELVSLGTYNYGGGSILGSAGLNIEIDPRFADASSFNLVFSPGIGISSSVPEPTTWAVMLFGFGVMGGCIRLRHRARYKPLPLNVCSLNR